MNEIKTSSGYTLELDTDGGTIILTSTKSKKHLIKYVKGWHLLQSINEADIRMTTTLPAKNFKRIKNGHDDSKKQHNGKLKL